MKKNISHKSPVRVSQTERRNDKCACGSGAKFKKCCSPDKPAMLPRRHIDMGESAVGWVICDRSGIQLFADADGRALVFKTREEATAIIQLEEFADQDPGDINVAGVGETKLAHLKAKIAYVEIEDIADAIQLVRTRIELRRAQLSDS